jgi:hypothetical protein
MGVGAHNHILETSVGGDPGMATLRVLKFENVCGHPPVPKEGQAGRAISGNTQTLSAKIGN